MKPRYQVSAAGVALIKRFEGYRRHAARLAGGGWTIGYGHSRSARQGAAVSEADAEALLRYDLIEVVAGLNGWIFTPLTQNQVDALASFAFNIGLENFRGSAVLRRLNEGDVLGAAAAIEAWRGADFEGERIVVDALVRRRAAEKALFLTPQLGFVPTPTPVVEPKLDDGLATPTAAAATLDTPLEGQAATAARVAPAPAAEVEDEPSPSQVAAEAVTSRLEALIVDLDERPITDPDAFPASVEPEPEPEPQPFGRAEPAAAAVAPASTSLPPSPASQPARGPISWTVFDDPAAAPRGKGLISLSALGLVGLVLFAGAVLWMFNVKPAGGLSGPMGVGAAVALVGVLCVVAAIYVLLERLGDRDG